jgi:hypothetical protein
VQPPILILHICGGILGMLSGFAAAFLRKGSRRHDIAGNVFVASMPILSVTGTYMAFLKSQPGNVLGGALTFYLVATRVGHRQEPGWRHGPVRLGRFSAGLGDWNNHDQLRHRSSA